MCIFITAGDVDRMVSVCIAEGTVQTALPIFSTMGKSRLYHSITKLFFVTLGKHAFKVHAKHTCPSYPNPNGNNMIKSSFLGYLGLH